MSGRVRLGLIGAGPWSRNLIRTVGEMPNAALTHLARRRPKAPDGLPPLCQVTTDWRCLNKSPDVDGVIVAGPAHLHAEMATACLEAGRPVLVEKPFATTLETARALRELAAERRAILQVDHTDLFNPAWAAVLSQLSSIGPLARIEAGFGGPGPVRSDVTPLWDWGPHPIALCLAVAEAEPTHVNAEWLHRRETADGSEEIIAIELAFAEGPATHVRLGNALAAPQRRLRLIGRRGQLLYDDKAAHRAVRIREGRKEPLPVGPGSPLRHLLERFVQSIAADTPDWADADLGLAVVETLTAADRVLRHRDPRANRV